MLDETVYGWVQQGTRWVMSSLAVEKREERGLLLWKQGRSGRLQREVVGEPDLAALAGLFPGLEGFAVLPFWA